MFSQLLLSNQRIEQRLNFLESEREKGKFSSQPVANPRGQHKIMSVTENTSTGSLKANTSLRTSHQPGHGAQSPFDLTPSAKFIPPFPPPVPPVQPNFVTSPDSNQTPHLPRAPYPNRLAPELSYLKILGSSSKMCTSISPSSQQSNGFRPIPDFSKISAPSRERHKYVAMSSLPHLS